MKSSMLYRLAAVLLVLFFLLHTIGFSQSDPAWKAEAVIAAMQSVHFDMMGAQRSYWDLFLGAGYSLSALYLFSALLAWQLARLPAEVLEKMGPVMWAFPLGFAGVAIASLQFLFIVPIFFSATIAFVLALAAWQAMRERA